MNYELRLTNYELTRATGNCAVIPRKGVCSIRKSSIVNCLDNPRCQFKIANKVRKMQRETVYMKIHKPIRCDAIFYLRILLL